MLIEINIGTSDLDTAWIGFLRDLDSMISEILRYSPGGVYGGVIKLVSFVEGRILLESVEVEPLFEQRFFAAAHEAVSTIHDGSDDERTVRMRKVIADSDHPVAITIGKRYMIGEEVSHV